MKLLDSQLSRESAHLSSHLKTYTGMSITWDIVYCPRANQGPLTFIVDEEANASPAAVGGEEQVHVVACADEELWCLGAMILSNQWG